MNFSTMKGFECFSKGFEKVLNQSKGGFEMPLGLNTDIKMVKCPDCSAEIIKSGWLIRCLACGNSISSYQFDRLPAVKEKKVYLYDVRSMFD